MPQSPDPRICPLCDEVQDCDQAAFEYHVNAHLTDERGPAVFGKDSLDEALSPFDDAQAGHDG